MQQAVVGIHLYQFASLITRRLMLACRPLQSGLRRMSQFTRFERQALRTLMGAAFGPATVDRLVREAIITDTHWSGHGYQIDARHPCLPTKAVIYDTPLTVGRYESMELRFTVRIHDGMLQLDCQSLDGSPVPPEIRKSDVQIEFGH